MKKTLLTLTLVASVAGYAQQAPAASGGSANGAGGSVTFTVGQVAYTALHGNEGSVSQGVQQAYEIFELGTSPVAAATLVAYPNPTADYLVLNVDSAHTGMQYTLHEISGRKIGNGKLPLQENRIDLSKEPSGTYLLTLTNQNKTIKTFKIVKK